MVHLSGGGGLGCRITHWTECEHVSLAGGICGLAIDSEPGDVLGKARGGVTGGVLGGEAVHDALGGVPGRAFVVEDEGSFKFGRIFLLKSFSDSGS